MRVVVDTNVLISAGLKKNSPPETALHLIAASHLLLKSTIAERELFVTLARPRLMPLIDPHFRDWLRELMATAELIDITERVAACRDPKDDKFLELAVNGRAELVVSGDRDLLILNPFRGIPIITPADFVQGSAHPALPGNA
jgi:putative PIN family toxin of toxin-antitoxin system